MPFLKYLCTNGHLTESFVAASALADGAYLTGTCPVDAAATTVCTNRAFGAPGTTTGCGAAGVNVTAQVMLNKKSGGLQEGAVSPQSTAQGPSKNVGTYPGPYGDSTKNLL